LPAEANELFAQAKKVDESQMQVVIGEVADDIGARLAEAKRRRSTSRRATRWTAGRDVTYSASSSSSRCTEAGST
jgi:hypothetical protein